MSKNVFIGGAWPYANNSLHVGHLAALLPGDIIARYYRQHGDNVIFVSGTDSHGTPITLRARKEKVDPQEIASRYHEEFKQNFEDLDFSYDLYTSTMTPYHAKLVAEYLKKINNNGYIYKKEEDQDFCPCCDTFLSDREIVGVCPHCGGTAKGDQCDSCLATLNARELKDKTCSICHTPTEQRKNSHLYLALSRFQEAIRSMNAEHSAAWRLNAVSETNKFLEMGLIDRAITRQLEWGIDVPFKGYEDKKIYVWIEAVLGYLTAGQKVAEERGINFEDYIRNPETITYYAHGKDNIPFHTVIYPALLMSIDEKIKLPDYIISSEYVNMNNEKMSKSKGNLISVNQMLEVFPKDSIRYYMIANGPESKDINFTIDDFVQRHNKFLVGVFGNFINRNLSYINKKFEGKIPNGELSPEIVAATQEAYERVGSLIEKGNLRQALETAFEYVSMGNKYYDDQKPWVQVVEDMEGFNNTTYNCVYMMANMSNLFAPFIPETCERIIKKLGLDYEHAWGPVSIGRDLQVQDNDLLFERMKTEEILEILKKNNKKQKIASNNASTTKNDGAEIDGGTETCC